MRRQGTKVMARLGRGCRSPGIRSPKRLLARWDARPPSRASKLQTKEVWTFG